ncbi:hypothetical protein JMJ35_005878 [Cladonia borealis]|uniref:Origin recognition complex subunit 4 n=1 Tax=Cladonia borealis TaxID=184061 RepID=A0AA39V7Z5_9LECA|nr:hypothetical protein JMJ35_005878 [Cladonia borealis]
MTSLELSPRAAKRRKTNPTTFANADEVDLPLPFHSRILKTVKQAVYGKARTHAFKDEMKEGDVFPVRPRNVKSTPKAERLVKESPEANRTGRAKDKDVDEGIRGDTGGRRDGISKKQKIGEKELRNTNEDRVGEEEEDKTPTETPIKKKRKKFKGYVWLDEIDDPRQEEHEDDVAGQHEDMTDKMDIGGDELNHTPTERGSDAEGSVRASGRLKRPTRKSVARREENKGGDAVATPASRRKGEREVEGNTVENGNGKPTIALRQNTDPQSGGNAIAHVGAVTTSKSRRKRDIHAQEVQSTTLDVVETSIAHRGKGKRASKEEAERVVVRRDEVGNGNVDPGDIIDTEDSPDELNKDSLGEELNIAEAPTGKGRKRRGKAAPAAIGEESSIFKAVQDPTTHASPQSDAEDSLEGHTPELQQLLSQDPGSLTELKTHILSGLTGQRRLPLVSLSSPYQKVHQLVSQTVLAGEGNSMLIIGSRGTGKTNLIETVISDLGASHQDDFHVVRLNGFIHTDDKLALREIWRQLGREMDVVNDDLGGSRSSYADTLTSLLALLTHSAVSEDYDQPATTKSKSIIFILDEFHLFTTHPRQTLLYNLFDTAQSHAAPICVLGLTTNLAVSDALEKRVKSRFSQRYVHLSLPRTFNEFREICQKALEYHPSHDDLLKKKKGKTDLQHLSRLWNAYIHHLLSTTELSTLLHSIYTTQKSIPTFLSSALLPISSLSPSNPVPTPPSFSAPGTSTQPLLSPPDSPHLALLPALSTLQLSLLIAAARLETIYETTLPGFEAVYEEYVALASKAKVKSGVGGLVGGAGGRVWGKQVAKGAWEGVVKLGMVGEKEGRGGRGMCEVGLGEIGNWVVGEGRGVMGGAGLGRWCREI